MPYAQPDGPKILAVNITSIDGGGATGSHNDTVYKTYTFRSTVHYLGSYMNDLRFDLRSNTSLTSGHGVAYMVDFSNEGRTDFIMLDLGTGESWRRLDRDPSVVRVAWNIPSYFSRLFYYRAKGMPISYLQEGLDGIQISPAMSRIYYSHLTSTDLYSIPALNLRARNSDPLAELAAHGDITNHGQRGADANGFEGDDQGHIYMCMPTENGIYYYEPRDLQTHSASVGADGSIYLTINQLYFQPDWNYGNDTRRTPGAILRAKLPDGAGKIYSGD